MLFLAASASVAQASLRAAQPIVRKGKVANRDAQFGSYARQDGKPARPPGYRNAWDDCGGVGASATERMRIIAAKIKGWAKPLPFVRHAAQDCGMKDKTGTKPGPGVAVNFPKPEIATAAREGLEKAADTLKMYPPR